MEILFRTNKLARICNEKSYREKVCGTIRAKLIGRRLDELHAAECLEDITKLPGARCHELQGNKKGVLSVDLDQPYRLFFVIANNPIPKKPDGGLNWKEVTKIEIIGVEDPHG